MRAERLPELRRALASAAVSCAVALAGCQHGSTDPPNVILILVDTLRADRVGLYNPRSELTPFLDSLADRSTVFRHAYSTSSWTSPSVASLFTSRYQSQHGIYSFRNILRNDEYTLAEAVERQGYATAAFSAHNLIGPDRGFGQGFEEFRNFAGSDTQPNQWQKPRAKTIDAAFLSWLDAFEKVDADGPDGRDGKAKPERFFVYLHYLEVHGPYEPDQKALATVLRGRPAPDLSNIKPSAEGQDLNRQTALALQDYYDAEVLTWDVALRELFQALAARKLLDDSIVVITADHGQEFLGHGAFGHGHTLYDELIHIPLIFVVPGQEKRKDIEEVVSLVDVAPTILDLACRRAVADL